MNAKKLVLDIDGYLVEPNEDGTINMQAEPLKKVTLEKGVNLVLPYLNENSQEYKAAKSAIITQINVNNNEWCCEICGEKGHKSWACPLNINQYI